MVDYTCGNDRKDAPHGVWAMMMQWLWANAPYTGEIDMMIILAIMLIAAFLIFILVRSNRRGQ